MLGVARQAVSRAIGRDPLVGKATESGAVWDSRESVPGQVATMALEGKRLAQAPPPAASRLKYNMRSILRSRSRSRWREPLGHCGGGAFSEAGVGDARMRAAVPDGKSTGQACDQNLRGSRERSRALEGAGPRAEAAAPVFGREARSQAL